MAPLKRVASVATDSDVQAAIVILRTGVASIGLSNKDTQITIVEAGAVPPLLSLIHI